MRLCCLAVLLAIIVGCGGRPTVPALNEEQPIEKENAALTAPIIKVYVENSGSMDGYVKGATDFENAVYSYLSDIQMADLGKKVPGSYKNTLELNYINSKVLKHPSDVEEFIKKLEPTTFRQRGGNRGASDMSDIIGKILEQTDKDNIAVFVSDCIFSPGKRYKIHDNADEYLVAQQIGIKNHIVEKLAENPDFAFVVLHLTSQFDGMYYNKFDERTPIKADRPFYIWLMGDKIRLAKLMEVVDKDKIKGSGTLHSYMMSKTGKKLIYGILPQESRGRFDLDRMNPKTTLVNAKTDGKGGKKQFQLAIGVNYADCLLDDGYLMNPDNYAVSNKAYALKIIKNNNPASSYTHIIKLDLTEPIISKGCIKISLLNKIPSWIENYTDTMGLNINAEGAMNKTYGLKYLIGGVYDAYAADEYGTITINIK